MDAEIIRHDSFKVGYHAMERMNKAELNDYKLMKITAPADVANLAVAYAAVGTFKDALGDDSTKDVIASGVPVLIGADLIGFIFNDCYESAEVMAMVKCEAPNGLMVKVDPADLANIAPGDKAYMIPLATASTGGMVTSDANSGTNILCGRFLLGNGSETVVSTAGRGTLPVGTWLPIALNTMN